MTSKVNLTPPSNGNGTGTWVRWVFTILVSVALFILVYITKNAASNDRVDGLDRRVGVLEKGIGSVDEKLYRIMLHLKVPLLTKEEEG